MKRVSLDAAPKAVREFVATLPVEPGGLELELGGHVLFKLVPPSQLSEVEKQAVLKKGWDLIRRARERNQGVPAKVIEREVRDAVNQVRKRRR